MKTLRELLYRLRALFSRNRLDAEMREEMQHHLDQSAAERTASGDPTEEARFAAQRKFGRRSALEEQCRDQRGFVWLEQGLQDLRYAFRQLCRNPTFSTTALLTLALGIGATTAIFSVVHGVLLKPLPYPDADQLVAIAHEAPGANLGSNLGMSPSMLYTYREHSRVIESIGGWTPEAAIVTGLGEAERTRALLVTFGTLQALKLPPLLGREFTQEDDVPGAPEVVLLSHGYWQRRFGGDAGVVGRTLVVDSRPRQIIGVMPAATFRLMGQDPDFFIPMRLDRNQLSLGDLGFQGLARLKPGITVTEANADVARMLPIWLRSWRAPNPSLQPMFENAKFAPLLRPLKDRVIGSVGNMLWIVMGTVSLVLLIACANVANLLLVRAEVRRQECGIRLALGASRSRLVRQALAENLLLGCLGGGLGLALAFGGLRLLRYLAPTNLPRQHEIGIDSTVLWFALGVSMCACLVFGVAPAFKAAGSRFAGALRTGGRSASMGRDGQLAQNCLVVGQVTLAVVLLVASGLTIRTFQSIQSIPTGFSNGEQVQTFRLAMGGTVEPARVLAMQTEILEKLSAIPGVSVAALANSLPMEDVKNQNPLVSEDHPVEAGNSPPIRTFKFISPGLLAATGTRLIAGRDLTWADVQNRRTVVLVSESLAREHWGSPAAALGRRVRNSNAQWREVVGVVEDVRDDGVRRPAPKIVYWPFALENFHNPSLTVQRGVTIAVRSPASGTEGLLKQIRQAVASVDPNLPVVGPRTLQRIYDRTLTQTSFALVLLSLAGGIALVLCLIGVYGVIAYTEAQARREIGIRMALGASTRAVRGLFVRRGLALVGAGLALGLVAAFGLSRLMSSMIFGVTPLDPAAYAGTIAVLLLAGLVAAYLPAQHAARVKPVEAIRGE